MAEDENFMDKAFWQTFHEDIEVNNKKISELEKKITEFGLDNDYLKHGGLVEQMMDKIEKLEASSASHTGLKLKGDQNFDDLRNVWQEVNKLKLDAKERHYLGEIIKGGAEYYKKRLDDEKPPEPNAGSARQMDEIEKCPNCDHYRVPEDLFQEEVIRARQGGGTAILGFEDPIIVEKADLCFLFDFPIMDQAEQLRNWDRFNLLEKKYLKEDEK